ncbi:MAG: YraN family protein [Lentisphaerae bacterium]|nr:YraN family protein [Lentisphaerota bacterium]
MWKILNLLLSAKAAAKPPTAGRWGEEQAERALRKKGYAILGRRVRIGRRDELDLVARDGAVLVFIEVKTRKTETFGRPVAAVNRAKRHYLARAAVRYLKRLHPAPRAFRFDVVEVIGAAGAGAPLVRHIENAFPLDRCYRVP